MDAIVPGGTRRDLTRTGRPAASQMPARDRARGTDATHDLRRTRGRARSVHGRRHRAAGARRAPGTHRACRSRERPGVRSSQRPAVRAVYAARVGKDRSQRGDVAARVAVRFDELQESCRLVQRILDALPDGPHLTPVPRTRRRGRRRRADRGLARASVRRARSRRRPARSAAVIRTIPRGRTGRCSSTRSSATSSRISRSSTSPSTFPTAVMTCRSRSC